jgi:tetratricopeptide (TPR) repeat protein
MPKKVNSSIENELDKLLRDAKKNNKSNNFEKVIVSLSDDVLNTHRHSKLYAERASAYFKIKENDKALIDISTAIELDPTNYSFYQIRGYVFLMLGQYEKVIADVTKSMEYNSKDWYNFYLRGYANWMQQNYDQAIQDYTDSLQLNSQNVDALNERGRIYSWKKEFDLATADFNQAILLNPGYTHAFNNRGLIYYHKKQYEHAILEYGKAIEIDANYYLAYLNRAKVWYEIGELEKAKIDIKKAFELSPGDSSVKYWANLIRAKIGETIIPDQQNPEAALYFINNIVEKLPEEIRKQIIGNGADIIAAVDAIRDYTFDISDEFVVHFTKLNVANIFVSAKESRFRYYNVVYMNDPEEGEVLLKCLNSQSIRKAFEGGQKKIENNVYVGSFLPLGRKDDLVMWRTYGKGANNVEAAGCGIIIDSNFFDRDTGYRQSELRAQQNDIISENGIPSLTQSLSKVIYFDTQNNIIVGADSKKVQVFLDKLSIALHRLISLNDNNDPQMQEVIDKIVFRSLSELRYLFKSADYFFESELRVIQYVHPKSDEVQVDDCVELPRRLFVQSSKTVQPFLRKIILGPKVINPKQWLYLEVQLLKNGNEVEVVTSNCHFQ